ncbi:hypothetical protein P8C59_007084 [Phyllachora maydis]|uniref:Uncharacterized protein n=1 Tax=Phyllachora maydis TaxID=1825666 RepID=A0AAD9I848_9PEZI|nr:hypothetical protein P8C59_007084 [Phyllachora maydis]
MVWIHQQLRKISDGWKDSAMASEATSGYPCSLTIDIPFPNARLASIALRTIQVDKELSSLVRRTLSTVSGDGSTAAGVVLRAETSLSSWK